MKAYAIVPAAISFSAGNQLVSFSTECRQIAETLSNSSRMQESVKFLSMHPLLILGVVIGCIAFAVSASLRS